MQHLFFGGGYNFSTTQILLLLLAVDTLLGVFLERTRNTTSKADYVVLDCAVFAVAAVL